MQQLIIKIWLLVLLLVLSLIIGVIIAGLISFKLIIKYLKNNPSINRKMIKSIYLQAGKPASEKSINQAMIKLKKLKD